MTTLMMMGVGSCCGRSQTTRFYKGGLSQFLPCELFQDVLCKQPQINIGLSSVIVANNTNVHLNHSAVGEHPSLCVRQYSIAGMWMRNLPVLALPPPFSRIFKFMSFFIRSRSDHCLFCLSLTQSLWILLLRLYDIPACGDFNIDVWRYQKLVLSY